MNIILLGAQGSGKGTLAKRIKADFGLVPISTGDLFRQSIANGQPLGLEAKKYMDRGELVPLDLTLKILTERIKLGDCAKGVILDGFPRSIEQAEALKKVLKIYSVICLELSKEQCMERMLARRICPKCGATYSTLLGDGDTCTKCGVSLVRRDDDNPDAIKTRLEVYEKMTTPLINFYSDRLLKVSADVSPEEVYKPVKDFLSKLGGKK